MVAGLDGVELPGDLVVELVGLLFLTVEHTAFEGQGQFFDARNADDLRLDGCQTGCRHLVGVAPALTAADAEDVVAEIAQGHVDGELVAMVEHLACVSLLPHVCHKHGLLPDNAERAPSDGHGVDLVAGLGGQQDARRMALMISPA